MPKSFDTISTPAVLLEQAIIKNNILRMKKLAARYKVSLRVHVKTHKMPELAHRQIRAGAVGIAVARVGEAEIFARTGIHDIQIANLVVGEDKLRRVARLTSRCRISLAVDSTEHLNMIASVLGRRAGRLQLLAEVNSGLNRGGVDSFRQLEKIFKTAASMKGMNMAGLMTHAGHAYGATSKEERSYIGTMEGAKLVNYAERLRRSGYDIRIISVGSTPTAHYSAAVNGVTELRVGNYIFNDMTQVALGVAPINDCALTVMATVISVPSRDRVVIDAGSKALSLDKGAHGRNFVEGFGYIVGTGDRLSRLSEEHGIIDRPKGQYRIGDRLRIIPNHACAVMNLFDYAYLVSKGKVIEKVKIAARGRSD